jgi:two-component system chemotaxis response regulator CheB
MRAAAHCFCVGAVGVLLTGMGRDGADGMAAIAKAGGMTIAQDEASSVVYGMPFEAVKLGAVQQQLPLEQIGPMLISLTNAE